MKHVLFLFAFLLLCLRAFTQKDTWIYPDTLHLDFNTESIIVDLGTRDYDSTMRGAGMRIYFTYDALDSAVISRTITTDPQWICQYPTGYLQNDTLYNCYVCNLYRIGPMNRYSGFQFSTPNGNKQILFRFKGMVNPPKRNY